MLSRSRGFFASMAYPVGLAGRMGDIRPAFFLRVKRRSIREFYICGSLGRNRISRLQPGPRQFRISAEIRDASQHDADRETEQDLTCNGFRSYQPEHPVNIRFG